MKNKLIAASIIILFSTKLFCQQKFHVGLEQISGVKIGSINEYVFYNTSSSTDKLSELNWHLKPVWYLGGKASLEYNNLCFDLMAAGFIDSKTGTLEDSDWQNVSDHSMKTNYSISDNYIKDSFFIESNLLYTIPLLSFFRITPFFNFKYEYFSFTGKDGEGWYGDTKSSGKVPPVPWNDPKAKYYSKGKLGFITYNRFSYDFYFGLKPEFLIKDFLKIGIFGAISPFTLIEADDNHYYISGTIASDYLDSDTTFFSSWKCGGAVEFSPINRLAIKTGFTYSAIETFRGNTYQRSSSYYSLSKDSKSGFSQNYFDISLSVIYRPF